MSEEQKKHGRAMEKIARLLGKVDILMLIRILRFFGIPIKKDP